MLEAGVKPADIREPDDLTALPFTSKADLETWSPELLCVPDAQIVDLCQTSGTTGAPVVLAQTEHDLQRLGYNEMRSLSVAGVGAPDRVMIACALGRCFMAGIAYFEGARKLGCRTIRAGSGSPTMLAEMIRLHCPTVIVGVPSQILEAAEVLSTGGLPTRQHSVRKIIAIGEPIRSPELELLPLGRRLVERWDAQVLGTYASTEMATAFPECEGGKGGGHIHPDLIVVELIGVDQKPVPPGMPGEVVATPLQVTGMPLLRLRTGDLAVRLTDTCPCGYATDRLGPVIGRQKQMLKIRGTTVYPQAIFSVLQGIAEVSNYFLEVYSEFDQSDKVRLTVGTVPDAAVTEAEIAERIRSRIRVLIEVIITDAESVTQRTLGSGKRKPQLFFDLRDKKL